MSGDNTPDGRATKYPYLEDFTLAAKAPVSDDGPAVDAYVRTG